MKKRTVTLFALLGFLSSGPLSPWSFSAERLSFETVELDSHIGDVCYAVTSADVDADGDLDAVAISENQAVWYRNPEWTKQVMVSDVFPRDLVCIAPHDIDGDGLVDFAIGAGWPQNGGTFHWIRRRESLDQPWIPHNIASEPWTHRMKFADILGTGRPQLVVSPLNASTGTGVRLLAFPIPADPQNGPWTPIVADGSLNRLHNHWHLQEPGAMRAETITASEEGISRLSPLPAGGFERVSIAAGASGKQPTDRGAGEVKAGRLASGQAILGTIEPMHGNQVVIYLVNHPYQPTNGARIVLDESFNQGHAIAFADLDGDGSDELIAGFRQPTQGDDPGPGIFIYRATDTEGRSWEKSTLDAERMACEDLTCGDFNGDGKMDILAGGRASQNVRLYLNQSPQQQAPSEDANDAQ